MASATALSPHRRRERDGVIFMFFGGPARAHLGQQVELDPFTAAARAQHGGGPEVFVFTDEIEGGTDRVIRNVLDPGRLVEPPPGTFS